MPVPGQDIVENGIEAAAPKRLSILIPCLNDDPCDLVRALEIQAAQCAQAVEIIVLDDGSNDDALAAAILATVRSLSIPATFIRLSKNVGRAAARNELSRIAEGEYILFIDADTIPDSPDFLQRYLDHVPAPRTAVVIGGFSLSQSPDDSQYRLHRHMSSKLDCLSAEERNRCPWKYAFGSNILVRRDVMMQNPFDPRYVGWGWEDQEWAIRISHEWDVEHIDNTVSHLGLDKVDVLLAKYASSGENFRFMISDHLDEMRHYSAYRASRMLRFVPFRPALRSFAAWIARSNWMSLDSRTLAMRVFRALHYQ